MDFYRLNLEKHIWTPRELVVQDQDGIYDISYAKDLQDPFAPFEHRSR